MNFGLRFALFVALLIAYSCRPIGAPETKLPSQPLRPVSDFPNWEAAQRAGWEALRHSAYCVRVPAGVQPLCLIGGGIDRCSFVVQPGAVSKDPARFSITVVPPGLAIMRPEEFLLSDGQVAPLSMVRKDTINEELFWELKSTLGSRELHIIPQNKPYWLIIQYEALTPDEEQIADRIISTLLISGSGPNTEDVGPACPFSRKKRTKKNLPE
jgi:hypothetical protein